MNMGASLPLVTPRAAPSGPVEERRDPIERERPKGRMLIFWGCGEAARAGQPVILDFASMAQGQMPSGYVARRVAVGSPPGGRTSGYWPNPQDSKAVPDSASLHGEHTIRGNYTPDIRFALGDGQDFMERVALQTAARGAGMSVQWNAPATATGYFATAMGGDGNDIVFWSSSEVQESGGLLMDYVPPGEVARLIRERVVLAPQTTECTVPGEVIKRMGGAGMFNFIAYGPEANFGFPPRPQDPQWAVKVRYKSTAATFLGETGARGTRRAEPARGPAGTTGSEGTTADAPAQAPTPGDAVREGIKALRGIFGR